MTSFFVKEGVKPEKRGFQPMRKKLGEKFGVVFSLTVVVMDTELPRSFLVETVLEWKVNNKIKKVRASLLLDSSCTGPILAQSFIKRNDIPVEIKKKRLHVVAANGIEVEGGTHNATSLGVWMGRKHVSKMKFESMGIREEGSFGLVGYLPMSWLVQHNPDIDWTLRKIKWRSEYCRKHCLASKIKIEWMTEEEILREPKEQKPCLWHGSIPR